MLPDCAVAVLTMMVAGPEPPCPCVEWVSDGDCPRCRKKKIPPAARMITNATTNHAQRCFLPDAGCKGMVGASSERAGGGVESDIFNSIRFSFRQAWRPPAGCSRAKGCYLA